MLDGKELLPNVARCEALVLTPLDKIDGALPVEGDSGTAKAGFGGPAETWGKATIVRDGPTLE